MELSEDRKAALASNLLIVLCGEGRAQPVLIVKFYFCVYLSFLCPFVIVCVHFCVHLLFWVEMVRFYHNRIVSHFLPSAWLVSGGQEGGAGLEPPDRPLRRGPRPTGMIIMQYCPRPILRPSRSKWCVFGPKISPFDIFGLHTWLVINLLIVLCGEGRAQPVRLAPPHNRLTTLFPPSRAQPALNPT